ncbi:uncharacterized protein B0I36DRAFT_333910 [Microdochium trichocladiopsis]|uniref:Uncharacterized protein n=1 Tax=Microdochium trichocladiopsis TaxID=1682393 RepID=A0A9P8XZ19_9PEZI|nr:uncharacterized protein B0I36DRAFT_333910 [Microdochium trichocladiopsis]KAH7021173.1 hypothetical protein B0I36DRAFT_333910 [Microdochium trichocladiopsis]
MSNSGRNPQLDSPPLQREYLDVTPRPLNGTEKSKPKTKHGADINAAFKKLEADMDTALGRKGPPSPSASRQVWDDYLNNAMAHLQKRSHERNRWEQLETLQAEQDRMRQEPFRFVLPEGDEGEEEDDFVFPGRAKVLRQRKVPPVLPPLAMESSRKRVMDDRPRQHTPKKNGHPQPAPNGSDSAEAKTDNKTTNTPSMAENARDSADKEGRPGSAKKKRLTEDLNSNLGAAVSQARLLPNNIDLGVTHILKL